jgi:RND family efflux transporter MFP subunit
LARVTNLSSVWVIAQVYEKDLGRIRSGSGASITTDAYPGRVFRGQVTYIDPNINQETRTAQARVELENPGQMLKLGMYVRASFGALGTGEMTAPVISSAAVQNMSNQKIVFVATDKPSVFVMKTVRLGTESNGQYVVLEGLNVGDKVVTEGSFLLRAELMKQSPTHQH